MRSTFDGESGDLCTKICACVAAVFIAAAVIGCALRLADKLRPKTGDMISFDPASGIVNATRSPITAVKVGSLPAISCTLEPRVMQASGGSLMINPHNSSLTSAITFTGLAYARAMMPVIAVFQRICC